MSTSNSNASMYGRLGIRGYTGHGSVEAERTAHIARRPLEQRVDLEAIASWTARNEKVKDAYYTRIHNEKYRKETLMYICPECAQGKVQNCAQVALNDADEFVPCVNAKESE